MKPYLLLDIYRSASGKWAGCMLEDGKKVIGIGGCVSAEEVESSVRELGWNHFVVMRPKPDKKESVV